MKHILTLGAIVLGLLGLASCHKTCTCTVFNGVTHTYTADEVEARGVTCYEMRYQAGEQYYTICNWD